MSRITPSYKSKSSLRERTKHIVRLGPHLKASPLSSGSDFPQDKNGVSSSRQSPVSASFSTTLRMIHGGMRYL
jgi:hypothetical protein